MSWALQIECSIHFDGGGVVDTNEIEEVVVSKTTAFDGSLNMSPTRVRSPTKTCDCDDICITVA